MLIDRRTFTSGLAATTLLGSRAANAQADYLAELHAKAKQEGEVNWYIVYWPSERAELHAQLFSKLYPGIKVNVVRLTAQIAYQRLSQDIKARAANCDVFATTDMSQYVALKNTDQLMPYKVRTASFADKRFQNIDPDDMYQAVNATIVGLSFNTAKTTAAEAPKNWKELLDPKWKEQKISVGHPGFSGFVGVWVVQMTKLYRWEYFEQLAALKPMVGRSIIDAVSTLVTGERMVAVTPTALVMNNASRGSPIAPIYPDEGSVLMISGSAIMKSSRHPNAAKLFMEHLYSLDTMAEDIQEFGIPVRPDAVLPAGFKKLDELKTIRPTIQELIKEVPEVIEKWRDTFGV